MRVAAQPDSLTRSNASRPAGPAASTNSRAAFTTRALESPSNLAAESSEPLRAGRLGCGASGWSWCSVIEADIADGNREEGVTIASGTAPTSVPSRATQAARFMANRICAASRHRMQRCHRSDAGAMRRRSNVARRSASRARSCRTRRCHRPRCASLRPSKKICTHRREIRQRSPRMERERPRETEAPAASPPAPGLSCRRHGSEIHNQRSPTHCCIRALASYGSRPNSRPGGETGRRTSLRCWRPLPGMQVQFLSWAPLPAAALDAASGDDFPSARCGDGDHRPLWSAAHFPRRVPRSSPSAAPTAAALPQRRTHRLTSW